MTKAERLNLSANNLPKGMIKMALKWLLANAIGDCLAFAAYYLGRGIVNHVRRQRRKHQELEYLIREMTNDEDNKEDVTAPGEKNTS